MSLARRLLLSYIALVAVTSAVLIVGADRLLRGRLTAEAGIELAREAQYFEAAARRAQATGLDSLVHALSASTGRGWFLAKDPEYWPELNRIFATFL